MYKILGVAGLILFVGLVTPASVSSETLTVTHQIKVTATILPARHVVVDTNDKILQIISNTSDSKVEPTVYIGSVDPKNIIFATPFILDSADDLLAGKTIKPGILYDYREVEALPTKASKSKSNQNLWLSGIFNLKNVSPTVNLTRL